VFKSIEINLGTKSDGFKKEVNIRDGNGLCWSHDKSRNCQHSLFRPFDPQLAVREYEKTRHKSISLYYEVEKVA
jgi:hypothetical protein